ncbi:hypothetical protein BEWA_013960 [Theileria equi strain WA]|uniref:Uncharacterized protein n=1 Tax=Theileria equi strain WA TaxID=1537102 RepID=L1LBN8_THEEQ|nr:hypothetical protein BEWA_013960 [Theileria equi strain WA]EKX72837.1 hypothetical protein BEWA_013960 [Theileria equi strain WA]|eukprot:XP_004832289.1 hypothetical protein BEWA_013960 [Theileria equi strain WA]
MEDDQGIIIELKNKPTADGTEEYPGTSTSGKTVNITVKRSNEPQGSNFYRYTHTLQNGGGQFKLKEVLDDHNTPIPAISQLKGQEVTSVDAYYWKHDNTGGGQTPGKALLIGVTTQGNATPTYYGNVKNANGNKWIGLGTGSTPNLLYNDIERTLDDLVCSNYGILTMDLSKGTSMSGNKPYCCRCHGKDKGGSDQQKITVERKNVSCTHKNSVTICKHSIDGNYKLATIRYYNNGVGLQNTNDPKNRRRITAPELKFPIPGSLSVHALYCGGNPVLIYVKGTGQSKWYKKPATDDSGNEKWEEVNELKSVTPKEIQNDCKKYNKLIEALKEANCGNFGACPPDPKPRTGNEGPGQDQTKEEKEDKKEEEDDEGSSRELGGTPAGPGNDGPAGPSEEPATSTQVSEDSQSTTPPLTAAPKTPKVDDPSQLPAGQESRAKEGEALARSAGSSTPKAAAANRGGGGTSSGNSNWQVIFGGSASATVVSGATFFAGYKFYTKYKGDPWVRQI